VFCAVYIEIEDLLHQFSDPNVMDIKMGTRSVNVSRFWCVLDVVHIVFSLVRTFAVSTTIITVV